MATCKSYQVTTYPQEGSQIQPFFPLKIWSQKSVKRVKVSATLGWADVASLITLDFTLMGAGNFKE